MRLSIVTAVCTAAILSNPWIACSQHYYVVVGAFAAGEKASEFKGYLPDRFMDTTFENSHLLHFYVFRATDKESAISKAVQLKQTIERLKVDERRVVAGPETITRGPGSLATNTVKTSAPLAESSAASASSPANAGHIPPKPVGKYFRFNVESPEGQALTAQVHHIDFENGREIATYRSDTFIDLLRPGQTEKPMVVACGLFGYKEIYKYIDYSDPSGTDREAYVNAQGVWVIPYKLERVEEGDVSPAHNISFYKDAAVMRKTSQVDLDELIRMMHINPYYEVTIHAHCNGKNRREIIAPGADRNYFDAAGAVRLAGTAKDLTTLRAGAIRAYLTDHGVDPARVTIFSWGASDMPVKADDPAAELNNRIEIEFTRD